MRRKKVIFYGFITLDESFEGDGMEIEEAEDTLKEQLETLFQNFGYNAVEVSTQYEENNLDVANPEKRPERLIDANNINWSGMFYTAAFAEMLELVLQNQKAVPPRYKELNNSNDSLNHSGEYYRGYYDDYGATYDPCDGCSGMLCAECLYSGE